jgi:hypothetical protein
MQLMKLFTIVLLLVGCKTQEKTLKVVFFNKPLTETTVAKLNAEVEGMPLTQMDIQSGGAGARGVSTVFAVSRVFGQDSIIYSTGHLSCMSVKYLLPRERYFVAHIDCENVPATFEYDSLLRAAIALRIGTDSVEQVLLGAGNASSGDSITLNRLEYIRGLTPTLPLSKFDYFCGPNTQDFTLEEMVENGGARCAGYYGCVIYER